VIAATDTALGSAKKRLIAVKCKSIADVKSAYNGMTELN
jgi:hypothetical protein